MSNQPLPPDGGDFTTLPPPPGPIGEGVQREEPERPAQLPTSLMVESRPLDFRRKQTPWQLSRLWLLAALVLPAVALGSWYAGGNDGWRIGTALGILILVVLALVSLRHFRSLRRRNYVTFGYLIACCGIWFGIGHFCPLTTVLVGGVLVSTMEREPATPLRVRYGGKTVVDLDRSKKCAFSFRGRFDPKRLQIESLTPEGWIPRTFANRGGSVEMQVIPTTLVYVDNRNNGPTTLTCGEVSFALPAEAQEIYRVPGLKRLAKCPVMLDGRYVGNLTDKNILVDTLGTRSYTERTVVYGNPLEMHKNNHAPGAKNSSFRKKHVHELPDNIDFFLEPAPKEIEIHSTGGGGLGGLTVSRTELLVDDP